MRNKAGRNTFIEALRLFAVAGIAIFHTFQWTFQAVCDGDPAYTPLAAFPYSAVLGFINLLGCWANEVFFMISGYFLVASATRAWRQGATWKSHIRPTIRRLGKVLVPTVLYCLVALAWSTFAFPIEGISLDAHYWFTLGLEFIWVYAATVCLAPCIGLVKSHISNRTCIVLIGLLTVAVFTANGYIAIHSLESNGELSWIQKTMSAVTYVLAFLAGGVLRDFVGLVDKSTARTAGSYALPATLAIVVLLEASYSLRSDMSSMAIISYKSTSLLSFVMAAASLLFAATREHSNGAEQHAGLVVTLSGGTLGFYVLQSLTNSIWRPAFNNILADALLSSNSANFYLFLGIAISIAFSFLLLAIDRFLRFIRTLPTTRSKPIQ